MDYIKYIFSGCISFFLKVFRSIALEPCDQHKMKLNKKKKKTNARVHTTTKIKLWFVI